MVQVYDLTSDSLSLAEPYLHSHRIKLWALSVLVWGKHSRVDGYGDADEEEILEDVRVTGNVLKFRLW